MTPDIPPALLVIHHPDRGVSDCFALYPAAPDGVPEVHLATMNGDPVADFVGTNAFNDLTHWIAVETNRPVPVPLPGP